MSASPLRRVLRISGPDARSFLQGLISNDVNKVDNGLVYAALLTPQGKYLADFFLLTDGDAILLDVAASHADGLLKRLNMYRLRADVQISESDICVSRGTSAKPDGALLDPRHSALGWRLYDSVDLGDDGTDWDALRVAHCIPETDIELTPDTYLLEVGFEALNGVDFRKGCYVGQEVTARMKHKTELRKGLTTVQISGQAQTGSDIVSNAKPVGTLLTQSGDKAIAYLRFDRAKGDMQAGDAQVIWPLSS